MRLKQANQSITNILKPHIAPDKLNEVVGQVIDSIKPMLKLPSPPDKGATVMTEGATRNRHNQFNKGPSNL